jgi:hypothetical protein
MGQVTAALRALREACQNSTVLVLHHTGHQEQSRMRGHSLLKASADWILGLRGTRKPNEVLLSREKARDESAGEKLGLCLQTVGDSCVLTLRNAPPDRLRLATQVGPTAGLSPEVETMLAVFLSRSTVLTTAKWMAETGSPERTFHRHRRDLVNEGLVECLTKRGFYKLRDLGASIRFKSEVAPPSSDVPKVCGPEADGAGAEIP